MSDLKIIVNIGEQVARLMDDKRLLREYPISSAANGTGYELGSNTTPLGKFRTHKKIGAELPVGSVLKSRVPTGEVCNADPGSPLWQSAEDLILSRVLWLEGREPANSNTKDRYIYLHGTNQESLLGKPVSHGCIRFANSDIVELFEQVQEGTEVIILA